MLNVRHSSRTRNIKSGKIVAIDVYTYIRTRIAGIYRYIVFFRHLVLVAWRRVVEDMISAMYLDCRRFVSCGPRPRKADIGSNRTVDYNSRSVGGVGGEAGKVLFMRLDSAVEYGHYNFRHDGALWVPRYLYILNTTTTKQFGQVINHFFIEIVVITDIRSSSEQKKL